MSQGKGASGARNSASGSMRRPIGREADEVVAVGADAMQQHDELTRLAAVVRACGGVR